MKITNVQIYCKLNKLSWAAKREFLEILCRGEQPTLRLPGQARILCRGEQPTLRLPGQARPARESLDLLPPGGASYPSVFTNVAITQKHFLQTLDCEPEENFCAGTAGRSN
jgi:hypothetical protein